MVYLLYQLPTVVISRRTDQYSKAHEILTGMSANAAKRPRTVPQFPPQAASVPPPAAAEASLDRPSRLAHASSAPEGAFTPTALPLSHPRCILIDRGLAKALLDRLSRLAHAQKRGHPHSLCCISVLFDLGISALVPKGLA